MQLSHVALALVALLAATGPTAATRREAVAELAPGIISTGHEFTVTFSPSGDEAFFTRSFPEQRRNRVMRSTRIDGVWQPATPVALGADDSSDLDPALSIDGRRLYFVSTRPRPAGHAQPANDMDIWFAERTADGWGAAHWLEASSADANDGSPTLDRSGTLCFFSDRGAAANVNSIYCAEPAGHDAWAAPRRVDGDVNTAPSNTSPWLSPDGATLLFYSTRPGGAGSADLYIAHKHGANWGDVRNLGPVVNSAEAEYNPSVSRDGSTLYFGRGRRILAVPLAALDTSVIAPRMFR